MPGARIFVNDGMESLKAHEQTALLSGAVGAEPIFHLGNAV
ncbi:MAG TPA: hypothetical protein VE218_10245 [Acidobacteriaceae bacterium]|nr:hypothetical protein [Acidobacteriaceae bacterium]